MPTDPHSIVMRLLSLPKQGVFIILPPVLSLHKLSTQYILTIVLQSECASYVAHHCLVGDLFRYLVTVSCAHIMYCINTPHGIWQQFIL